MGVLVPQGLSSLETYLDILKDYLQYNQQTGEFTWIKLSRNNGKVVVGDIAGSDTGNGYIEISCFGIRVHAHRLAWYFIYRCLPEYIDHADGNKSNNRIANLREANQSQNIANSYPLKRGVEKHGRKYRARIWVRDERIELGSYETREEAQAAYHAGASQYFGDFARINRPEEVS